MGSAVLLTVLALPFVVLAARVGRRRWVRPSAVGRVRTGLFRHWVRDEPTGRHLIRS